MNFDLSEEQQLLQQTVKQLLDNECSPIRLREIFEGDTGHDPALWKGMVEMGLSGLAIAEDAEILDDEVNRDVLSVVSDYQGAMESRDVSKLKALVSDEY